MFVINRITAKLGVLAFQISSNCLLVLEAGEMEFPPLRLSGEMRIASRQDAECSSEGTTLTLPFFGLVIGGKIHLANQVLKTRIGVQRAKQRIGLDTHHVRIVSLVAFFQRSDRLFPLAHPYERDRK
jgi:hypothetical protein